MATVMQRSAEAQRRLWKAEKLAPADVDKMLDDIQDQRDDMQELSERLADTGGDDYADAMCQEVRRALYVCGGGGARDPRVPAQRCGAYALSACVHRTSGWTRSCARWGTTPARTPRSPAT